MWRTQLEHYLEVGVGRIYSFIRSHNLKTQSISKWINNVEHEQTCDWQSISMTMTCGLTSRA
jgi:hypothetical protein